MVEIYIRFHLFTTVLYQIAFYKLNRDIINCYSY